MKSDARPEDRLHNDTLVSCHRHLMAENTRLRQELEEARRWYWKLLCLYRKAIRQPNFKLKRRKSA